MRNGKYTETARLGKAGFNMTMYFPALLRWLKFCTCRVLRISLLGITRERSFTRQHFCPVLLSFLLFANLLAFARSSAVAVEFNSAKITGTIVCLRLNPQGAALATNLSSFNGVYQEGKFLVDISPDATEDEIEESAGWNGQLLYLIQRWPDARGKALPRTNSLGYKEPTIFSRYATHSTAALLMALADSSAVFALTNTSLPILLGSARLYPEEKNQRILNFTALGDWRVRTICPAFTVEKDGKLLPLDSSVYSSGFLRWTFSAHVSSVNTSDIIITFEYERFRPKPKAQKPSSADDLIKDWQVEGTLRMEKSSVEVSNFLPAITEKSLPVWDFSSRMEYASAAGNFDRDYLFEYSVTNGSWEASEHNAIKGAAVTELGVQIIAERQRKYSSLRWVYYGLVVVIILAFPLLMTLKRRNKTNSE